MHVKIQLFLYIFIVIFIFLIFSSSKRVLAAGSLAGYWKLDESTAGSTVIDSSGNGNSGTPHGAGGSNNLPQPNTSVPPNIIFSDPYSLNFDGIDDYVDLGTDTSLRISGDLTLAAWVKFNSDYSSPQTILSNTNSSGSVGNYFLEFGRTDNHFTFIQDGSVDATSIGSISDNNWHHIVITRSGSNPWVLKFYIDGVLDSTTNTNSAPGTFPLNAAIGRPGSFDGNYFKGNIDDARIYNQSLTAVQIANLAAGVEDPLASPSPSPNAISSSNNPLTNNSGPSSCNDAAPVSAPDLFEIDPAGTFVNLYFVGSKNPVTGYNINYGLDINANQYGDDYKSQDKDWESTRTIYQLSPNTVYYFRVQGANGCNAGAWSKTLKVKTKGRFADIAGLLNKLNPFAKKPIAPVSVPVSITGCSYQVQSGDSLWLISQKKWGTGTRYPEIVVLNPGLDPASILHTNKILSLCQ